MASPVALGDIVGELNRVVVVKKAANALTAGAVMSASGGTWDKTGTAGVGPFLVCQRAATAGAATVEAVETGEVYVKGEGAINVGAWVMPASTTAGLVKAYAASAITGATTVFIKTARDEWNLIVGIYMGHVDEGAPTGGTPTAGADNDTIRILLTH